ncbi:MAG: flagellar basal body P-ring formation chaperone FlgA [Vibrio gallaecicus]|uniref:Flagella basal body P-ring formation protein FlgA n=1 Tax=Vibrio gallaecicus TaxID=552386 RepID=A0ABV4N8K9_9VIBR|nr:flagellar basal body P-ring formation chaperone FlgA [Vibrio gallaecicus]MDN3614383.1 flagellar basal body P-ring formation chaperone FlgA [Vibrio gallaecicus]
MMYYNLNLHLFSITKCRAFYKTFAKSIGILAILFSFFAKAATYEQIEMIQTAAETHISNTVEQPMGGELVIKAANIDSRVKATDCPIPLETSASTTSNKRSSITVLVQCVPDEWRIYVPVRMSMSVPLVTATRSLSRGELLGQYDVTITMIELNKFRRQGFTQAKQVVGAKVKKNLRPGDVVERGDICVVCRNEKVVIQAIKGGMVITTKGTALTDGSSGDQVRVKNDKSQRIIEGVVTDISEVTVYF